MSQTQDFVPIKDIKDGIIYMDDGRIKVVLSVSSLNLSLKSEDEQNAIIGQFQGFLNTLDFPIQIHAESRRVNIRPYLDMLEERGEAVEDELMKNQIREYRQFVKTFSEKTNIMNKRFFVIIDYVIGGGGIATT
jgi:conjugal transfer ATP-binding protein TraC